MGLDVLIHISCKLPEQSRLCHVQETEAYRTAALAPDRVGLQALPRILVSLAGKVLVGFVLVDSKMFSRYVQWVGGGIENRHSTFLEVLYDVLLSPTLKLNRMLMKRF